MPIEIIIVIARSYSDEAIQFPRKLLDCFATLAMTTRLGQLQ
jgi:hypothetical protein